MWERGLKGLSCRVLKPVIGPWLKFLASRAEPQLSSDSRYRDVKNRLFDCAELFRIEALKLKD